MFTGDKENVKEGTNLSRDESLYQNGDSFEELFGKLQTMKGIFNDFTKRKIKKWTFHTNKSFLFRNIIKQVE